MSITMTQRTFKIELFQGDDLDRLAELSTAARRLMPRGQSTGIEDGQYAEAAQAHDDFLIEAKTRAVIVEMTPMPRKAYQALLMQHPPREDEAGDAVVGANATTFSEPLLLASLTEPFPEAERTAFLAAIETGDPLPACPERQAFLDSLNAAQYGVLADDAFSANRMVYAPKAPLLGSAPSPSSDETSSSPDNSA